MELPPVPWRKPGVSPKGEKFSQAARASPLMFTPGLSMKLASSVAIVAHTNQSEISSLDTGSRRPYSGLRYSKRRLPLRS